MVVVSHLFSLLAINFRGGCDSKGSHPPLYKIIYFPTAPYFLRLFLLSRKAISAITKPPKDMSKPNIPKITITVS